MLQEIEKGSLPNDKTGTPARTAAQIINDNFAYLDKKITRKDGIVVSTGLTVVDQDATMSAYWQWIIDTIDYTNPVDVVINFPYATSGNSRLDMIALTTSNTAIRIAGVESTSNPVSPTLPDNMLQAALVLVTDASVGDPSSPVIGDAFVKKMESQDFIANYGATTVIDQIDLTDDRSSISLIGSATDVKSVQVSGEFIRPGKPHYFKNRTDHDVTIWHLAGTGNIKYFFPNELDLIVKPNEVIEFNTNANDSSAVRFEYVGGASITDLSDYYTKTEVDDALDLKLDITDYNDRFKGVYTTLSALNAAHPTANAGDYAQVNEVGATDVVNYSWDAEDNVWVEGGSGGSGATNTDALPEGSSNLYFTTARVLATLLTGISFATGGAIVSTDSVLVAFGKLQKQISDNLTAIGLKQDALVSGTNIKTLGGVSLLGSGDVLMQISITTSVSITTATTDGSGITQYGKHVLIKNGVNNINITVDGVSTTPTTYQKEGTGTITFVQGSGRTLRQVDGTAVLNGAVGSTASLASDGTTDSLRISNA